MAAAITAAMTQAPTGPESPGNCVEASTPAGAGVGVGVADTSGLDEGEANGDGVLDAEDEGATVGRLGGEALDCAGLPDEPGLPGIGGGLSPKYVIALA